MIFSNRKQAGRLLSDKLLQYKNENVVVFALPRGGVPVASEIAEVLSAPLDVLVVRKIGHPFMPELAVGAICEEGAPMWNDAILARLGLDSSDLLATVKREQRRIDQQVEMFRGGRPLSSPKGKVAILVDDGLATGATVLAAVAFLKREKAKSIIVAIPVAAASAAQEVRGQVDELVALEEPEEFRSVGEWYGDFDQVSDAEVILALNAFAAKQPEGQGPIAIEMLVDHVELTGDLMTFPLMKALIIFVHGSGSGRKSPRNQRVAAQLNEAGFGTLLFDLLTESESRNRANTFDIELLANRLIAVTKWARNRSELKSVPIGYFGASTGAGAAILAASRLTSGDGVYAIVSRGGRPDLAGDALEMVDLPTLLLVGGLDVEVIELNRKALKRLTHAELSIIPGATHVFEEPGTLDEVSKQAAEWFREHLGNGKISLKERSRLTLDQVTESEMVAVKSERDFERLIQSLKDVRVVMLGEASHGTKEFYQIRSYLSQRLMQEHGFNFVAVEGDWPDAHRLNQYIKTGLGESAEKVLMHNHRWPTWMWANDEVADLAEWMRKHGGGFYGLDVYSLFESIDEVVKFVKSKDMSLASEIEKRYACFNSYEGDEIRYARSLLEYPPGCESEVLSNLQKVLNLRVGNGARDEDALFSTQQNARVVANAESYYRAMLSGDASSWNVRDSHMMETLDRLLERHGEGSKAIVWAHNTHIGDYRATDMVDAGYVNLGGLARQCYGDEAVALVGFGTYQGEVLAGAAWGRAEQVMELPTAREESYEHHFHTVAEKHNLNQFYLLLEDQARSVFAQQLGHRAVGVVYDPKHERRGNYVPTVLSKRYDAFVFVDKTHALQSLHAVPVQGEFPDTWPSGV